MSSYTPMPLEWHPWYWDKTYLLDWLNGPDWHYRVPVPPVARLNFAPEWPPSPRYPDDNVITLTKQKAWGLAPFVGQPFAYTWNYATDQYGRSIAGDSSIHHLDAHTYQRMLSNRPRKYRP